MRVILIVALAVLLNACAHQQPLIADSGFAAPALEKCHTDLRYLNQVSGWQVEWPLRWQAIINAQSGITHESIAYWSAVPRALESTISKLRSGIVQEETAPRFVALRVHQQVSELADELKSSHSRFLINGTQRKGAKQWNALLGNKLRVAIAEFEVFLRKEYLPNTRTVPGLSNIKEGSQCFANAITWWTGLNLKQEDIESIGNRMLKETKAALAVTGEDAESVDDILIRLRLSAKNNHTTEQSLIAISESALVRAQQKTLSVFSKQASDGLLVKAMPLHIQAASPAGRYRGVSENSPAMYLINPSRANERRLMAEVIAFHEGVPGHHLWFSFPREAAAIDYESGLSGTVEGWAIYAEYLADEMGLFSSTLDRQGLITKHLWAASRLIVEPGLHLRGWSRERAVNFMLENTVMSRTEIEIEVDRYIAMPGQSLSYMLGADLLLSERARARAQLGAAFDLIEFHDIVLKTGTRPLKKIQEDIRNWLSYTKKGIKIVSLETTDSHKEGAPEK